MASQDVGPIIEEKCVQTTVTNTETNYTSPPEISRRPIPTPRSSIRRKSSNSIYPSLFKKENVFEDTSQESPSKIDAKSVLVSVQKELQCYICLSLPRPDSDQRWRCLNSHAICQKCLEATKQLVSTVSGSCRCGAKIIGPCQMVGKLMKVLPFRCDNVGKGCKEILDKEDFYEHEKVCKYRQVYCADLDCQKNTLQYIEMFYLKHISMKHEGQFQQLTIRKSGNTATRLLKMQDCKSDGFNYPPGQFKMFDDQIFYEVGVIENQFMYRWVYILATSEEAKKYQFCGKMKNKKGEKISYTGRVRTLDENKLEIVKDADTFLVSLSAAKKFANEKFIVEYEVNILKDGD